MELSLPRRICTWRLIIYIMRASRDTHSLIKKYGLLSVKPPLVTTGHLEYGSEGFVPRLWLMGHQSTWVAYRSTNRDCNTRTSSVSPRDALLVECELRGRLLIMYLWSRRWSPRSIQLFPCENSLEYPRVLEEVTRPHQSCKLKVDGHRSPQQSVSALLPIHLREYLGISGILYQNTHAA